MEIGDIYNGWTIVSMLGKGTFGKVYRLVKTEYGRTYESALKVIRIPIDESEYRNIESEGRDKESLTSYYQGIVDEIISECELMYELKGNSYSNIVSYEGHEVRKLEDSFGWDIYIEMELLTPLLERMEQHRLNEEDVIRLGIDICRALEICQKYNLIHRDIKPGNIFYSKTGNFKLGGFIARRMEEATAGMSRMGFRKYMAPEIYKFRPYNSTVDIYSLGILMYLLSNNYRTPFLPSPPEMITHSDEEKAVQRRLSGETIPPPCNASDELAGVILKACAYDPKERFKTAAEMRMQLELLLLKYMLVEANTADHSSDDMPTDELGENNDIPSPFIYSDRLKETQSVRSNTIPRTRLLNRGRRILHIGAFMINPMKYNEMLLQSFYEDLHGNTLPSVPDTDAAEIEEYKNKLDENTRNVLKGDGFFSAKHLALNRLKSNDLIPVEVHIWVEKVHAAYFQYWKPVLGGIHAIERAKKELYKYRGYEWYMVTELYPDIIFD